ncbi:hypothetical protein FB451DRAFT_626224, partial [Mycena latifolia]
VHSIFGFRIFRWRRRPTRVCPFSVCPSVCPFRDGTAPSALPPFSILPNLVPLRSFGRSAFAPIRPYLRGPSHPLSLEALKLERKASSASYRIVSPHPEPSSPAALTAPSPAHLVPVPPSMLPVLSSCVYLHPSYDSYIRSSCDADAPRSRLCLSFIPPADHPILCLAGRPTDDSESEAAAVAVACLAPLLLACPAIGGDTSAQVPGGQTFKRLFRALCALGPAISGPLLSGLG